MNKLATNQPVESACAGALRSTPAGSGDSPGTGVVDADEQRPEA